MDHKTLRVLIIEDDADQAGIIGSYLADSPDDAGAFVLTQAPRLSTACHLLGKQDFDIILIDLVLPQSVGLEGFRKIRAMKPSLPIIVLSGLQDEALAIQAVKLGAQAYLIKGTPDCCLLKRAIRYAIENKKLSNVIDGLLGDDKAVFQEAKTPERNFEPRNASAYEQIRRLQEEVRQGLRALEVKKHFISQISHELRNTLATMKTAVYCLEDGLGGSLTPKQTRMVDIISQNADRQTRIINNVLDLAGFRSGRLKIQFRQADIAKIIPEVVQEFKLSDASKRLQIDIDCRLPLIKGDPDLIAQVLRNLIGNALRFAKQNVVVKAAKAPDKGVAVSIMDDGAGISQEILREIFTQFVEMERPANGSAYRGTGLGLTICKEIISGHKGKLWAETVPGQGTKLSFILPANDRAELPAVKSEPVLST